MIGLLGDHMFYGQLIDASIPRKIIVIGNYKYRIVYTTNNKGLLRLQKKKQGIFTKWETIFTDDFEVCLDELRNRVRIFKQQQEKKKQKLEYALIIPKSLGL